MSNMHGNFITQIVKLVESEQIDSQAEQLSKSKANVYAPICGLVAYDFLSVLDRGEEFRKATYKDSLATIRRKLYGSGKDAGKGKAGWNHVKSIASKAKRVLEYYRETVEQEIPVEIAEQWKKGEFSNHPLHEEYALVLAANAGKNWETSLKKMLDKVLSEHKREAEKILLSYVARVTEGEENDSLSAEIALKEMESVEV